MDDSLPKIQIVKKSATTALSDLKNNPPGGPAPSTAIYGKEIVKEKPEYLGEIPQAPEIGAELREHGVEEVKETVELPPEVKEAGVEAVDQFAAYEPPKENLMPQIPLTTQQMQKGLHARVADSLLWLVYWCVRQIEMFKRKRK